MNTPIPQHLLDRLTRLADELGPDQRGVVERLRWPERVIRVFPEVEVGGERAVVPFVRIRHSTLLGPAKGGIRMTSGVSEHEVGELALEMTIKCALSGLPLGGGKGGLVLSPKAIADDERQRLFRRLGVLLRDDIGPDIDIPAPDVNTSGADMAAIATGWQDAHGTIAPAVITGKPVSRGGLEARTGATGRGARMTLEAVLADRDQELSSVRVAIQGFGKAGRAFAQQIAERGGTVVAVSDSTATVADPDGLDVDRLVAHKTGGGSLADLDGSTGRDDVFGIDSDVFVPAALGGALNEDTAQALQTGLVVEIANGASTEKADQILGERGVSVVPDILANAGGVIVSYREWVAGRTGFFPATDEINADLERRLHRTTAKVIAGDRWRDQAWVIALRSLGAAWQTQRS